MESLPPTAKTFCNDAYYFILLRQTLQIKRIRGHQIEQFNYMTDIYNTPLLFITKQAAQEAQQLLMPEPLDVSFRQDMKKKEHTSKKDFMNEEAKEQLPKLIF